MPLPQLIEMTPLLGPLKTEITVPGSKSITNRALILAALANGETTLEGALWSEDTQVMVDALRKLGFEIKVDLDPSETSNRIIHVRGLLGRIPHAGTVEKPMELFVGNAGTAARFLAALVCLGQGSYLLRGVPRMHDRPQSALFQALRSLGYSVDSKNDKLPAVIRGSGTNHGKCTVSITESSQFASALLLCAKAGGWSVKIVGEDTEESSYIAMTRKLIRAFPKNGGRFRIEPDASSGSYFWAAGWLNASPKLKRSKKDSIERRKDDPPFQVDRFEEQLLPSCLIRGWPKSGWQIDSHFSSFLPLPPTLSRLTDLGDSIMTAIVIAPLGGKPVRFTDLGRLRVQECERVVALRTELAKCGGEISEHGDELHVFPSQLHGAKIETYHDHRIAMCFAILGLKVPGIQIINPACVKKTFPNFFQKLAGAPPQGLGAVILDAQTRRPLSVDELFAE